MSRTLARKEGRNTYELTLDSVSARGIMWVKCPSIAHHLQKRSLISILRYGSDSNQQILLQAPKLKKKKSDRERERRKNADEGHKNK